MQINDFIKSVTAHKRTFAFLIALSIVLCTIGLKLTESHTAEIIIKYVSTYAEEGLTENGQHINPYEINSSLVVSNAALALGLKNTNIEEICRNIKVTPIVPTAEQEKYASWIESFSDYEKNEDEKKHNVYYSVTYKTSKGKDYAKRVLSAIISQYRIYYDKKYTYNADIANLSGEIAMQYDYYETVDSLREKINSNIEYLTKISTGDVDYRSPRTGYSLLDLAAEYKSLSEYELSVAERLILENGITKNASYLRNHLKNKATDAQYESALNNKKAETQINLMNVYSAKNREYLWDYDDNENDEGSQVREEVERDEIYIQVKSVYDALALDYVNFRTNAFNLSIDKQRYENDINCFPGEFTNDAIKKDIEARLANTCEKYNKLYEVTTDTINDYNEFLESGSIECISGVVSCKQTSSVFYYALSVLLAAMISVIISILSVYIDKKDADEKEKA